MSSLLEKDKVEETNKLDQESSDHDRFTHYFKNSDVEKAVFTGTPATALCGKKSIPMGEAAKYPVCPTCKEIYETLAG